MREGWLYFFDKLKFLSIWRKKFLCIGSIHQEWKGSRVTQSEDQVCSRSWSYHQTPRWRWGCPGGTSHWQVEHRLSGRVSHNAFNNGSNKQWVVIHHFRIEFLDWICESIMWLCFYEVSSWKPLLLVGIRWMWFTSGIGRTLFYQERNLTEMLNTRICLYNLLPRFSFQQKYGIEFRLQLTTLRNWQSVKRIRFLLKANYPQLQVAHITASISRFNKLIH